jgi:hypothetical protein
MKGKVSSQIRRAVMAIVASGAVLASPCYAKPFHTLVVVQPSELPELARQTGEAMLLHDTPDGRTLLYVEQNQGAQLAILDVTDPGRIKGEGAVQLGVAGPFDFVSNVGSGTELVRFRDRQEDGMLDLHRGGVPTLRRLQGLTLGGLVSPLGNDGFIVSSEAVSSFKPTDFKQTRDYQVVDASNSRDANPVVDIKNVRDQVTNQDTGTTFILTDEGLYVIRRPIAESDKQRRDQEHWD